jgi:predicted component of type VI protein secretion system
MAISAKDRSTSERSLSPTLQETRMTTVLVTFTHKGARKDFKIEGQPQIIGRSPEADIRIPVSDVSRSHCEIAVSGKNVVVRDLGSSNGTFVNDKKVSDAALKAGDRIRVGPVLFTVQIDGVPAKIAPPQPAAPAKTAKPDEPTRIVTPTAAADAGSEAFDLDNLEELDAEDLSDFDLDELTGSSGIIEEVEGLEEIGEDDLIPDDDPKKKK